MHISEKKRLLKRAHRMQVIAPTHSQRNKITKSIETVFKLKIEKMPFFKRLFMGLLIDKISSYLKGLNLQNFMKCMKKSLAEKLSINYLKKRLNEILNMGKSIGSTVIDQFNFFRNSFKNIGNILNSWKNIKTFVGSVKNKVMSFFKTLKGLFSNIMDMLNGYLNPFEVCQNEAKSSGKKTNNKKSNTRIKKNKKSGWGFLKKGLQSVKKFSSKVMKSVNKIGGKAFNYINKGLAKLTPSGLLLKVAMNPGIIKDVIYLTNELIINGLIKKQIKNLDWSGVGERLSRVVGFLIG